MNLVETLMKQFGPVAGQLSGLLGEDQEKTQSALGAVIPTLLAGFAGDAESPEGAKRLNAALAEADDDPGARLGAMLKGEAPPTDALGLLGGLIGGGSDSVSKLTATLTRFLGIKEGSVSKLIAVAVPLVLGYFKKHKKEQGLDDAGFSRLLAGQKDQIAKAMPDGLGKMLAGTAGLGSLGSMAQGLFGSAGDAAKQAGDSARKAATEVGAAARKAGHAASAAAPASSSMMSKIIPLLVVIAIAFLLWKMFSKPDTPSGADGSAVPTAVSLTDGLRSVVSDTSTQLSSITDVASAREALPELKGITERFGTLASGIDKLPAGAREGIAGTVGKLLGELQPLVDKVMAIPGVSEILQPVLGPMLESMKDLAGS